MEVVFKYGKCIFARPNMNNVDDMVEMMNNEKIASMLFTNKKEITREMEIDWVNRHQNDNTFSVYDNETLEYIGNCGFNEIDGNRGEIGLTIRESMQGKHYAKDIINGFSGDYIIKSISLPLDINGTMSLSCTKALERI